MLVPMPAGDNEHIALGPVKALVLDHRVTRAAKDMIDRRVVMPMLLRVHAGAQLLCVTGDAWHHRTAGMGIEVFEPEIVIGIGIRRQHAV